MNSTPGTRQQRRADGRRAVAIRTAGMIVFAAALLLLVMGLTILRNEPTEPHGAVAPSTDSTAGVTIGSANTGAPVATETPTTTQVSAPQLSAFRQAKAAGGFLTGAAAVDQLQIYDSVPPGSELILTFPRSGLNNQISATFLIIAERNDPQGATWYQIRLPIRPNGSTGWVKADDLTTTAVFNQIRIFLSQHRLDLYEAGRLKKSYPIGVGTEDTPTPLGEYYITSKLTPESPYTVYGVLAMGVSGFSEKLSDWPLGGQVGIHGTNSPSSIGKDVSHGCIRLHNEDILDLSEYVAYGTPVVIEQ